MPTKNTDFEDEVMFATEEVILGHHFGNGETICVDCVDVSLAQEIGMNLVYAEKGDEWARASLKFLDDSKHRLHPDNLSLYYEWLTDKDSAWTVTQHSGHEEMDICDICKRVFWDPDWL